LHAEIYVIRLNHGLKGFKDYTDCCNVFLFGEIAIASLAQLGEAICFVKYMIHEILKADRFVPRDDELLSLGNHRSIVAIQMNVVRRNDAQ
jgi:hypothetical protein